MVRANRLSYYLCSENEPLYRLPNVLHKKLVTGELAIPQFANTRQRIAEVLSSSDLTLERIEVRGCIYSFDAEGRLDLQSASEAIIHTLEGNKPKHLQERIINIEPLVRSRRWIAENTWNPSTKLLAALENDFKSSRKKSRIPILSTQKS